jgi:hypothetical protein
MNNELLKTFADNQGSELVCYLKNMYDTKILDEYAADDERRRYHYVETILDVEGTLVKVTDTYICVGRDDYMYEETEAHIVERREEVITTVSYVAV